MPVSDQLFEDTKVGPQTLYNLCDYSYAKNT